MGARRRARGRRLGAVVAELRRRRRAKRQGEVRADDGTAYRPPSWTKRQEVRIAIVEAEAISRGHSQVRAVSIDTRRRDDVRRR